MKGFDKGAMGENIREGKRAGLSERGAVMQSMKRSKASMKSAETMPSMAPEKYPYGLRLNLEHEDLKKLGITKMPKAGAIHRIVAHAKVHRAEESNSTDGGKRRSLGLQITKMSMKPGC